MSRITLAGNASGTGTFTVASPNSNTDRTLNMPDAGGTLVLDTATQTLTNKTLTSPTVNTPTITGGTLDSSTLTTPFLASTALGGTAQTGEIEYNGTSAYFTPIGTQRGILPAMQMYRLNSNLAGVNATGAQSIFGVGCTLSASTVYRFELMFGLVKTAGTTSHTISVLFGGTATVNNAYVFGTILNSVGSLDTAAEGYTATSLAAVVTTGALTAAAVDRAYCITGTVFVNAGGTFIPQYSMSAAAGGAYSTRAGSYINVWPVSTTGLVNVGTWA